MIKVLSGLKDVKCSSFVTIKDYRLENGNSADYNIIINVDYKNAVKRSIKKLKEMKLSNEEDIKNRNELLESLEKSRESADKSNIVRFVDNDGKLIKSLKYNIENNTLYLIGYVVHKRSKNSTPKKLSGKEKLRSCLPIGKFRQFKIESDKSNFNYIAVNGNKIYSKTT